ncbi:MAG: N-acetyltransferase [Lewinellaceae bacterium]|nr:N-acetyltransferase [Saprospiraceae bacterium]MCB9314306.1 N-acetyltransferase [Lewinellaceae bacterium]
MNTPYTAHPSAVIDPGATIGQGTRIWHFTHIMPGAVIGDNCIIGQNVFIGDDVVLGNGVKVQNNVSIYTGIVIEDDVFLGPSVVLTNVNNPRANIERKDEFRRTIIKRGATIGANATIVCGHTLGAWCFIGAGAVVTRDVPDYALMTGNPARITGWMSRGGHKLLFDSDDQAYCPTTGEHYRIIAGRIEILELN